MNETVAHLEGVTTEGEVVPISADMGFRGRVLQVGWELPADMTEEEWHSAGLVLGKVERSVSWWVGDWWAFGEARYGERKAIVDSEDWDGPSFQTCVNAGNVCKNFPTNRRRLVLSFTHHAEVAALPPKQQERWLNKAEKEGLSAMKLRSAIRQAAAVGRTQAVELQAKTLGKFAVLYVDPPWRYENPPMGGGNRSIENHYPTMTLEEICALNIEEIANENAVMFLWATAPKLAECMKVIEAWGFTYRTDMIWDKEMIGMGYHVRNQHEELLICKRGELPPPPESARCSSVVRAPRGKHSEKPDEFYDIIERMYPDLRRIELFSRAPRVGWAAWGNQAEAA